MSKIETKAISKTFVNSKPPVVALDNFSIKIHKGEIVGLIGDNGAGKTTFMKILVTLLNPTSGTGYVNGHSIVDANLEVRKSVGYAPEQPGFYNRLSAKENLDFFAKLYNIEKKEQEKVIQKLTNWLDLENELDRPVETYSKGMKQKLLIIRTLLHSPEILVYDEPMAGLSPGAQQSIRNLLLNLASEGKTILISTHNLAEAERLVDKYIILNEGKILDIGSGDKLKEKYRNGAKLAIQYSQGDVSKVKTIKFVKKVQNDDKAKSLKITIDNYEQTHELIEHLIKLNIRISEVKRVELSLEEIYFHLINKGEKR